MAQTSAGLMRFLPGSGALADWKELDNKLEAFRLFQYPEREVGDPLREGAVAMALRLPDFRAIWVLEGIAHERAMRQEKPSGILPDRTGVSTHAGLGTALAEKALTGLGKAPSDSDMRILLREFSAEASAGSRPGWEHATLEPLGLVVRSLYPQWLVRMSDAMATPLMRSLFWHGAGRSSYFSPSTFIPIPGGHGRLVRSVLADGPDEDAKQNLISGLIWAAVLVNLPRPEVAASFAEVCANLRLADAYRNGLVSALMAWRHMAPLDATLLRPYTCGEAPGGLARNLWKSWVIEPANIALNEIYPTIERAGRVAELFRYHTMAELRELGGSQQAGGTR